MAKTKFDNTKKVLEPTFKKTSIGGNDAMIKTSSMNKSTRRSYKKYRGQGR
jgi:hypothetical protein